jgi:transposase
MEEGSGFSGKQERQQNDHAAEIRQLHAKIGQLIVEKDCLADASRRLGLVGGKR